MEDGGSLYIGLQSAGGEVSLEIRDSGKGMTREQVDKLGEAYFSTKGNKGTGLGMLVVHNIVESMQGSIHF
ncbi:MAG: ATP-binding protein [Bacillus sp. (in: firmicutes)]